MRKIRIGKDIKIRWGVTIGGVVADPSIHNLTLELKDPFGINVNTSPITLVGDMLETTFYGKDHKRVGYYKLTLWLNKGNEGQSVVDACDAFTLVSCSCDEGGEGNLDLEVVDVATASLDVGGSGGGGSGVSDYSLLSNKPRINKVVLNGNKTAEELGLQPKGDYEVIVKTITWDNTSNINDIKTPGLYYLKGERLNKSDNLPISNSNPGHTISARLSVLDSSISGTGAQKDKCITQILMLSNRTGQDGNAYIRTGSGVSLDSLKWSAWGKLQANQEVGQVYSLDSYIDNGIYSGVYTNGSTFAETFVMITINNYAAAGVFGQTRCVSQYKYSLNIDGSVTYKTRVGKGDTIVWGEWGENKSGEVDLSDYAKKEYVTQQIAATLGVINQQLEDI